MGGGMLSEAGTVLAQRVLSAEGPLAVLGATIALAFAIYLALLALTLRRERSDRRDGPGRNP